MIDQAPIELAPTRYEEVYAVNRLRVEALEHFGVTCRGLHTKNAHLYRWRDEVRGERCAVVEMDKSMLCSGCVSEFQQALIPVRLSWTDPYCDSYNQCFCRAKHVKSTR